MTDSMKFGPEWLRNLSGDSCNSGGGGGGTTNLITPRYQLAEHRYGREEMLALFDRHCKPPEQLSSLQTLFVEKTQAPLALVPMTEDEMRLWNGGISTLGGSGRGRGGSVDRGGRIRGGRSLLYSYHSRGIGYDDSGDGNRIESQSYQGRGRPFDRSQSERGWSERNGIPDPGEWNGSTSPRKEMSRGASGSSLMEGNWRRQRSAGEDEEGWRVASNNRGEKWVRGNWRDGGGSERARMDRADGDGDDIRGSGPGRWDPRGSHRSSHDSSHHHPTRASRTWEPNHHDIHDNLPEWATENPSESGGSFDASGAFHGGMYSDDDDDGIVSAGGGHEMRTRRVSEGNATTNSAKSNNKPLPYSNSVNQGQSGNRHTSTATSTANRERPKSLHPFEDKDNSIEQERRSISPTKSSSMQQSNKAASPLTGIPTRKVQSSANLVKSGEAASAAIQGPQRSKSFVEQPQRKMPIKPEMSSHEPANLAVSQNVPMPPEHRNVVTTESAPSPVQKRDDDFEIMTEGEASMLVEKLTADEESHRVEVASGASTAPANHVTSLPANGQQQEKWYYRDPQGEVQGPFLANEMAEWCKAGYFTVGLMVRRTFDERYTTLGDLMKMCGGRVPFLSASQIPPLKSTEPLPIPNVVPNAIPAGIPGSALPKTAIENPLILLQYQQMRHLQNQLLLRQLKATAIAKLSQSERWATLSPVEQNRLILQCVMQDADVRDLSMTGAHPFAPLLAPPPTNPVMQLFTQMQQAKTQADNHLPPNPHQAPPIHPGAVDPIQQLIQQMGGIQNLPTPAQPNLNPQLPVPQSPQDDNPIKSLLRQLNVNANGHPPAHPMESVWPQPPPQFTVSNWLAQIQPVPPMPPGQMPNSLWDLHTKEMKTEQQILEEQNIRVLEDRQKEELRKQEELQRQAEGENAKRKLEEDQARQAEEAKRKEEEKKRKEEEKRRKEEEKRKQEEELKKKEEKKRKEEEKKREEKRKLDEELNRKKQEEEKKKREELKKQEEKLRKEEEKRKKLEEEQKRLEEERLKKEEEARLKAEAEEQARRAEQRRREAEALKKLQERSKAPWAQAPQAPPPSTHTSLAEIQKLEREKKAELQRFQQLMSQQMEQRKANEAAQEANAMDSSKRLQFKWAEKATPAAKQPQVKSLAQIQQEEQERIAKVKQQEKERQEKVSQKEAAIAIQNAGIWGTASQSLNWASTANSGSQAWAGSTSTGGFWDEPTAAAAAAAAKPAAAPKQMPSKTPAVVAKPTTANPVQQQQQQQPQQNNVKANKSKNKKEEEVVKKLFENNTAKTDEFTQWCSRTLGGLQTSVDIPTFVVFLRDIESAYEVKEYVRMYLGDSRQCTEFAKQFLEKRSKWRSAQRPQAEADDLCKPAPAVNPNAPTEFQEVKGKSKKPKKGKMFKVDNRILGFSVTAATDRINVGDRDYGEGV